MYLAPLLKSDKAAADKAGYVEGCVITKERLRELAYDNNLDCGCQSDKDELVAEVERLQAAVERMEWGLHGIRSRMTRLVGRLQGYPGQASSRLDEDDMGLIQEISRIISRAEGRKPATWVAK